MGKKSEPEITVGLLGVNSTRIIFKPDLAKFHMTHLDDDVIALMKKRVIDMVGLLGMTVQVEFNGPMIPQVSGFSEYVYAYLRTASEGRKEQLFRTYQRFNDQLEVCVTQSEGTFEQVSFANKFATTEAGTHVDYVSNQIVAGVVKIFSKCFQVEESDVEESEIKRHLWVFVNATMDNPTFSSPTRETLTTPQESFGSSCELKDLFLENVFMYISGEVSRRSLSSRARKASKESAHRARKASKRSAQ